MNYDPEYDRCQKCDSRFTKKNPPYDEEHKICVDCYSQEIDYIYDWVRDAAI